MRNRIQMPEHVTAPLAFRCVCAVLCSAFHPVFVCSSISPFHFISDVFFRLSFPYAALILSSLRNQFLSDFMIHKIVECIRYVAAAYGINCFWFELFFRIKLKFKHKYSFICFWLESMHPLSSCESAVAILEFICTYPHSRPFNLDLAVQSKIGVYLTCTMFTRCCNRFNKFTVVDGHCIHLSWLLWLRFTSATVCMFRERERRFYDILVVISPTVVKWTVDFRNWCLTQYHKPFTRDYIPIS